MTHSTDLAAALESFIREEVARQLADLQLNAPAPRELPRHMTVREAADYARRSTSTVLDACQSGALFAKQRVKGGTWSIRPASVDAWLEGTEDPHREQVEKWQRRPARPSRPRRHRAQQRTDSPDDDGPAAA